MTVSFVDGQIVAGAPSVEIAVDDNMTLSQVIQAAFVLAESRGHQLPRGISPHPWLVEEALGGEHPHLLPMLDFIGVDEGGRGYLRGPDEDLLWDDFERGLDLRDPQVRTRHIAVSNAGGFGGGNDLVAIGSLFQDLYGSTPRWRSLTQTMRRLMGDTSTPWPTTKVAAQAKDFVQRGMPSKDAVSNFTRIRRRWDPAAYGDALGLTEREAKLMLVAVGYREAEHGLWVDSWADDFGDDQRTPNDGS